jgi:K+-transporting ATPase ATPase C chain
MRETVIQSVILYTILTLITGLAYPLAITAVAQLAWPHKANGSLITSPDGKVIGSELLGQEFTSPKYFWGRLSATSPPYNAGASSGSNLGPLNPVAVKNAEARIIALNEGASASVSPRGSTAPVPIDLVTASASGLDPEISVASAQYQIDRVAKARNASKEQIERLVAQQIERKQFGCLGEERVNVLKLNIALDNSLTKPGAPDHR